jgi:DNA adenine methylase
VSEAPSRPAIRWHGGKWLLAPWIIDHFPAHRTYVEPFGGGASVLLRKPRSHAEVYNDLDDDVVNLFEVCRGSRAAELVEAVSLTPFARSEFEASYSASDDPVEKARRLLVRSFMGFGSDGHNTRVKTGFRASSTRSGTTPASDWKNFPASLAEVIERMRGVVIESRDAVRVMRAHDSPTTLHYVDPPYLPETRSTKSRKSGERYHAYKHELTRDDHVALLKALRDLEGMVVLSGYPSSLYDESLPGWRRAERTALADGARARTEVLWCNPAAFEAKPAPDLFGRAA